jgi:hypothetical protein
VTIGGGSGDTITGGTGNYFLDAHSAISRSSAAAPQQDDLGGAGDTIRGGAGNDDRRRRYWRQRHQFIDADLGNQSSSRQGNDDLGGAGDTIQGASGSGHALISWQATRRPGITERPRRATTASSVSANPRAIDLVEQRDGQCSTVVGTARRRAATRP